MYIYIYVNKVYAWEYSKVQNMQIYVCTPFVGTKNGKIYSAVCTYDCQCMQLHIYAYTRGILSKGFQVRGTI